MSSQMYPHQAGKILISLAVFVRRSRVTDRLSYWQTPGDHPLQQIASRENDAAQSRYKRLKLIAKMVTRMYKGNEMADLRRLRMQLD